MNPEEPFRIRANISRCLLQRIEGKGLMARMSDERFARFMAAQVDRFMASLRGDEPLPQAGETGDRVGCSECGKPSWFLYRHGICGSCCNKEGALT